MKATSQTCYLLFIIFLVADVGAKIRKPGSPYLKLNVKENKVTHVQKKIGSSWNMGLVSYYLDNNTYDYIIADQVSKVIIDIESASCVRFQHFHTKPIDANDTWIHFTNPQGERKCVHAPIYTKTGEIILVLGFDCLKQHEILHTLLHALGFDDEVTHPQRDQYIRVLWNNIQPEYRKLYRIRTDDESKAMVEYDPLSIMHFHDRAFTMNGQATIMPLIPGLLISPSKDLSLLDKMRLRLLFEHECNKRKVNTIVNNCKKAIQDDIKPIDEGECINNLENTNNTINKDNDDVVEDKSEHGNNPVEPDNEDVLLDEYDDAASNTKIDNDKNVDSKEVTNPAMYIRKRV